MEYNPTRALKNMVAEELRPREMAKQHGCGACSTQQLLAILIGSGSRGENVLELCDRILREHDGRLHMVARHNYRELMNRYRGIGEVKALEILAALELGRRCQLDEVVSESLTNSADVYRVVKPLLGHLRHEEMWVLALDRAMHVVHRERVSSGGTANTVVDIKMVIKPAIEVLASNVVLAHNHPSGTLRPSAADDSLTDKVTAACRVMDINLADHLIVTTAGYYSYADQGRLH